MKFLEFSTIKRSWILFFQFTVWILAFISVFLIEPPKYSISDSLDSVVLNYVKFIVLFGIPLMIIPLKNRSRKKDYVFWYRNALLTFFMGLTLLTIYNGLIREWSLDFYGVRVVKGASLVNEHQKRFIQIRSESKDLDIDKYVKYMAGNTKAVFFEQDLKYRYYMLIATYTSTIVVVAVFMIVMAQTLFCYWGNRNYYNNKIVY